MTSIGESAFYGCNNISFLSVSCDLSVLTSNALYLDTSKLKELVLGCENVTSYFKNKTSIEKITLTDGVKTISDNAFSGYTGLKILSIANSVNTIGNSAFRGCYSLSSLEIPNSVTTINPSTFYGCSGLTFINIPTSVTSIGNNAFENCSGLNFVTIPNSVTTIGQQAFKGCSSLASVIIPNSMTTINNEVFAGCSGLASVTIPASVTSIGYHAFEGCSSLPSLTIPTSVTSIGEGAFKDCSSLTAMTIPSSMSYIDCYLFQNCSSLASVSIPESVTTIELNAFSDCTSLASVILPSGLKTIGSYAFQRCTSLKSIVIPQSVTTVGDYPFSGCRALASVTVNCPEMGQWFSGLKGLTEIKLSEGVKKVGNNAFNGCTNVVTIDIGSTVTTIGTRAFGSIDKLTDVTCRAIAVPGTDRTAFADSFVEYVDLHVPASSLEAYRTTAPWSGFKNFIALPNELPEDAEKCATPTISYANHKLTFTCETEGATCLYTITDEDIKSDAGNVVDLTVAYTITVYATKAGYENSDVATATLCWLDVEPGPGDITTQVAEVRANPVLITSEGGVLTLTGVPAGTYISVYNLSGQKVASATATAEATHISTTLSNGEVAIVKIGSKSVKVMIK